MEATPRFELGNKGFADLCLTTWLCRLTLILVFFPNVFVAASSLVAHHLKMRSLRAHRAPRPSKKILRITLLNLSNSYVVASSLVVRHLEMRSLLVRHIPWPSKKILRNLLLNFSLLLLKKVVTHSRFERETP